MAWAFIIDDANQVTRQDFSWPVLPPAIYIPWIGGISGAFVHAAADDPAPVRVEYDEWLLHEARLGGLMGNMAPFYARASMSPARLQVLERLVAAAAARS
jgi:hypothetical protein